MEPNTTVKQVHELMTLKPVSVTPGTSLGDLMELFERHDFNAFPVVDHVGVLRGIVTKLDVLRALRASDGLHAPDAVLLDEVKAETLMRRGVIAVEPGDAASVAADLIVETRLRSLPVVQRPHGRAPVLVGMVSQGDLVRWLRFEMADARAAAVKPAGWPRPA
jgi:CBS domain-containing protein